MKAWFCLFLLILSLCFPALAEMEFRNADEKQAYELTVKLGTHLVATSPNDPILGDVLSFIEYLYPNNPYSQSLRNAAIFGEKPSGGQDTRVALANHLLTMQGKESGPTGQSQKRLLYTAMGHRIDPGNLVLKSLYDGEKASGIDLTLAKLLKDAPKVELFDPVEEARKKAEEERLQAEAARKQEQEYANSANKPKFPTKTTVKILKAYRFKKFAYSEQSALNAINILIHRFHWLGITFSYSGKRLAVIETKTASNGATFYYGPFAAPFPTDYVLTDVSVWDIFSHMSQNMDLSFNVEGSKITITDAAPPDWPEYGPDGLPAEMIQRLLEIGRAEDVQQLKGKKVRFNAYITGIKEDSSGDEFTLILDGSLEATLDVSNLNMESWKALRSRAPAAKKESGLSGGSKGTVIKPFSKDEVYKRKVYGSEEMYIKCSGVIEGIQGGVVIIKHLEEVVFPATGQRLTFDKVRTDPTR